MALEVIHGEPRNRALAIELAKALTSVVSEGTVYLGYPVLATADDRVFVDALLVSHEHGLVAFQIAEGLPSTESDWSTYIDQQDRLYRVLESHLGRHDSLRRGRDLALTIETVTVFSSEVAHPKTADVGNYCSLDEVPDRVVTFPGLDREVITAVQAALQRVTTIRPAKRRRGVQNSDSRGAILKLIEKGIANLDTWQKRAAIETPEGPQRIRGLAGSGKTIVLALKAAYLHAQHPEWNIAVCFQTRALYQQFDDLVTRFTFEHSNDKPDFEQLKLLHAWGASGRDGVYKSIARSMGATFRDWNYAAQTFGRDNAFQGVCRELLEIAKQSDEAPIFDAVLIDEAQDLPPEFFQLVYRFTREPKRIVWAFDELQNLSESAMPTTEELFGTLENGESLVSLSNVEGEARRDVILQVCYRNSPWALATAHSLGFGIYRQDGLVQHFDDLDLWRDIGYNLVGGSLEAGSEVRLQRSESSHPGYFADLMKPDDALVLKSFGSELEQDSWVAEQIAANLSRDELEHDDLLIVLPDAYTSKRRASRFSRTLSRLGIDSHLVGVGSSVDEVFIHDSVAVAHIHRAKGNEAPMVYVLDSQYATKLPNVVTRRNILFTAITRSRAWVRVCGWGDGMDEVMQEVAQLRERNYRLDFKIPTADELTQLRRIHRERSGEEIASIRRVTKSLSVLVEAMDRGEVDLADLPPDVRTRLLMLLSEDLADDPDE